MFEALTNVFKIQELKNKISKYFPGEIIDDNNIKNYLYRPFEIKKIYYKVPFLGRARENVMKYFYTNNLGLIISKQFGAHKHFICLLTREIN